MKIVVTIISVVSLAIALMLMIDRFALKSRLIDRFRKDKRIDKTANIVTEIKKIAMLVTACYYEDLLIKEDGDKIIYIVKGTVHAGIDLKGLRQEDIHVQGDKMIVSIPHSTILDVIVNPSDIDPFKGNVNFNEVKRIVVDAKKKIVENAKSEGKLLARADEIAEKNVKAWFKVFGFKDVNVKFK